MHHIKSSNAPDLAHAP